MNRYEEESYEEYVDRQEFNVWFDGELLAYAQKMEGKCLPCNVGPVMESIQMSYLAGRMPLCEVAAAVSFDEIPF